MTATSGRRWCSWDKVWEIAPRCVVCEKTAKLHNIAGMHKWWWPCGHAIENERVSRLAEENAAVLKRYDVEVEK